MLLFSIHEGFYLLRINCRLQMFAGVQQPLRLLTQCAALYH